MLTFRLQKYDSDDDHFLSLPEAQILADEIFDMGPDTATTLLDGVDHRKTKKVARMRFTLNFIITAHCSCTTFAKAPHETIVMPTIDPITGRNNRLK